MKVLPRLKKSFITASILLMTQQAIADTLLVSHVFSNTLSFHDDVSLNVLKEINVGPSPHEVVLTQDKQYALISNFGDVKGFFPGDTVTVVDVAAAKIEKIIQLPYASRPHGFAILSDTKALVTAQGIQSLLLIDYKNGSVEKVLPLPGVGAHMVVVDANQTYAYVNQSESGSIVKIDLNKFKVIAETKVGTEVMGIALAPNGLLLAVDRKENKAIILNSQDLAPLKSIATQKQPTRIELFNHGKSAVVANSLGGTAQVIDLETLNITNTFNTSNTNITAIPINIFVNNDQRTAYVSHYSGEISYVDLLEGKVIKTIKSGVTADGITLAPVYSQTLAHKSDTIFESGPVEINASIDTVWNIAKDINHYYELSQSTIYAHVDGDIVPGKTIEFQLYKDDPLGKIIPTSYETVTVVDEDLKILTWVRKLPDGQYTSRSQLLQTLPNNKTSSYIVLHMPGVLGKTTDKILGKSINQAFQLLNEGIKQEAERSS